MTAEVVVMNKSAVALAADSAITISSGRLGVKTYETVNKLFELIKGSNIGVMIYANAEINGVPWETVIKSYRREYRTFRAPHVEDYAEHFTEFLRDSRELLPLDAESQAVKDLAYWHLLFVFEHIEDNASEFVTGTGKVVKRRLVKVVEAALDAWEEGLEAQDVAAWAQDLPMSELSRLYEADIKELIQELFAEFPLPTPLVKRMTRTSLETLNRCVSEPSETGLVIAGFGDQDYFPKMYTAQVRGRLAGVLRLAHQAQHGVTLQSPGFFDTFAQDEQAWGWLSGITSDVRDSVIRHWSQWAQGADAVVLPELSSIPGLTPAHAQAAAEVFRAASQSQLTQFLETMNRRQEEMYVQPVLASISALPKDELGVLAESLVNVTSLKQRVSIYEANTVGGAIDVALISVGDGFVWLSRKHYFSRELNPSWHLSNSGTLA